MAELTGKQAEAALVHAVGVIACHRFWTSSCETAMMVLTDALCAPLSAAVAPLALAAQSLLDSRPVSARGRFVIDGPAWALAVMAAEAALAELHFRRMCEAYPAARAGEAA